MDGDTYDAGKWLAICDSCGFKFKSDEIVDRWDGFKVCKTTCNEIRNPQDFIKTRTEEQTPWSRPQQADVYIGPTYISTSTGNQVTTVPSGNNDGSL